MRYALDIEHTFDELCPQHRPALLNLARRYTGQESAAEDLTQETLLKAYRHWSLFKQETTDLNKDVKAWLKRILTNTFYTEWARDQKRHQMQEDFALEFTELPEDVSSEEHDRLHKVMDKLRPMYREVLDLHYMQDKSYQEIADQLNIKFVQVQKRLYRARQYVKTYYESYVNRTI